MHLWLLPGSPAWGAACDAPLPRARPFLVYRPERVKQANGLSRWRSFYTGIKSNGLQDFCKAIPDIIKEFFYGQFYLPSQFHLVLLSPLLIPVPGRGSPVSCSTSLRAEDINPSFLEVHIGFVTLISSLYYIFSIFDNLKICISSAFLLCAFLSINISLPSLSISYTILLAVIIIRKCYCLLKFTESRLYLPFIILISTKQ